MTAPPPTITDCVEQYLRCYMAVPDENGKGSPIRPSRKEAAPISAEEWEIRRIGAPYEGPCLIFDCETTRHYAWALMKFTVFRQMTELP